MNAFEHSSTGTQPVVPVTPGTLRASLESRAASGQRLSLERAVTQLVPLCVEVAEIHAEGYGLYLHPSNVLENADGTLSFDRELATHLPLHPRDRACLPPETRPDQLNDARGNVYALGAMLYELVTGESVGQGMRRPSDVVPGLPPALEQILAHALIVDPAQRPADITALAEAIHQLAPPSSSVPSPPHSRGPMFTSIPVDVSFSLLPPAPSPNPLVIVPAQAPAVAQPVDGYALPKIAAINAYGAVVHAPATNAQAAAPGVLPQSSSNGAAAPASSNGLAAAPAPASVNGYPAQPAASEPKPSSDRTEQILELRAQLEADPRARYFVFKDGMDHGPFTALELVQHIDAHDFADDHKITDTVEQRAATIGEWPPFSLFAEHAKRQRELEQRKKAIGQIAALETKRTFGKSFIGAALLLAMLGGAGGWYMIQRGSRNDEVEIKGADATNVETDNDLNVKKKKKVAKKSGSSAGSIASGQSCEAAMDSYNEVMEVGGKRGQADITAGQYARVLNSGSYFSHCGVPNSMAVNICAAVQNGKAVGVTVSTSPADGQKAACIASSVRNLSFPSNPKLDVTRTRFDKQ